VKSHCDKMCAGESSVCYSESCECRFSWSRPNRMGFFEICEHVVMLRFPESTPCIADVFSITWKRSEWGRGGKIYVGMEGIESACLATLSTSSLTRMPL